MPLTLEDFLAKVYDRTQRTTQQTQHRSVLRFTSVDSDAPYSYPFKWATGSADWEEGPHAKWSTSGTAYYWGMPYPVYAACGAGTAASGSALGDEIERFQIPITHDLGYERQIVRLAGEAKKQIAVGLWREVGIYLGTAEITILSDCNTLGEWGSEGTLVVDATDVADGPGCLRADGLDDAIPFYNIGGLTSPGAGTYSGTDRFQMWYYIDDVDNLDPTEEVLVRLGCNAETYGDDYYLYSKSWSDLEDGWNWFSWQLSGYASAIGTTSYDNITTLSLHSEKISYATERIDKVRLFHHAGTSWGYQALATAVEKEWGETKWLYWDLDFS